MEDTNNSRSQEKKEPSGSQGSGSGEQLNLSLSSDVGGAPVDMQDEVMKRRLLIDGDGAGDDRRILAITKSFLAWVSNNENEDNDYKDTYKRMLTQLFHIEHCQSKTTTAIQKTNKMKMDYGEVQSSLKEEIEATKTQIDQYKIALEKAKVNRRKQNEISALARLVKSKTDRKELEKQKSVLEAELQAQKDARKSLDDGLTGRKRNLCLLVNVIENINELVAEDIELHGLSNSDSTTLQISGASLITSSSSGSSGSSNKGNPSSQLETIVSLEGNPSNNLEDISPEDNLNTSNNLEEISPDDLEIKPSPEDKSNVPESVNPEQQGQPEEDPYLQSYEEKRISLPTYDDLSE